MYTKLLIPLDGSTTAEQAIPHARPLVIKLGIPAELLMVIDVADLPAPSRSTGNPPIDETLGRAKSYLGGIADSFADTEVKWTIERGRPAEVIVQKAGQEPSTLISMATHGRSGLERWLLGSVTEKVLRATANPLFLIRARSDGAAQDAALQTVVVPLDGSELAETILPDVVDLAARLGCAIVLLRVYQIPYSAFAGDHGQAMYNIDLLLESLRDEAVAYLEEKTAQLTAQGAANVSYVAKEGLAADEIIAVAKNMPASLIAMCTHGRSGVKRWVLGSVTEIVVRHAGGPVLVIPAKA